VFDLPIERIGPSQWRYLVEFIDENGDGPGVRLRKRQEKRS
jgi:hypothetical protein